MQLHLTTPTGLVSTKSLRRSPKCSTPGYASRRSIIPRHEYTACSNCNQANKQAGHLPCCPNEGCTTHYRNSVANLDKLLSEGHTDLYLAHYTIEYLRGRGKAAFSSFDLPAHHHLLAGHQVDISWRKHAGGEDLNGVPPDSRRICSRCRHPPHCGLMRTRQFISRLLHISHSQWIYRNITLQNAGYGAMALQKLTRMLQKIDRYMELDPEKL
jgi:hypothetical protein